MLRNFTSVKIQRFRPGLNPQTWVPEASMLTTRPPKPSNSYISHVFSHTTIGIENNYFDLVQLSTSFPVLSSEGWKWSVFEL